MSERQKVEAELADAANVAAKLREASGGVDARDVHFYGGLLLAGVGGALVNVRWTLVVVGSVLAGVGLLMHFTASRKG